MSELTEDEVKSRLEVASDTTIGELYEFGSMLLQECIERVHRLDGKANSVAGYSGAIVTILVSTFSIWHQALHPLMILTIFLAALAAIIAGIFALSAMSIQKFEWFSTNEWMKKSYLDDPTMLKRYHAWTMYGVIHSHETVSEKKTTQILKAQWMLAGSGVLLLIGLVDATWKVAGPEITRLF